MQQKLEYKWAVERFKSLHSPMEFFLVGLLSIAICILFSYFDRAVDPSQYFGFATTRWVSVGIWILATILFLKEKSYRPFTVKLCNIGLTFLYLGWSITNYRLPDSTYFHDVQITTLIVLIALFIVNRMNFYYLAALTSIPLLIQIYNFEGQGFLSLMEYLFKYPINDKIIIGFSLALVIRHSTIKYLLAEIRYERAVSSRDYLFNILQHDIANSLLITNIKLNLFKTKNNSVCKESLFQNIEKSVENTVALVNSAKQFHQSLSTGGKKLRPISGLELSNLIRSFCEPIVHSKSQNLKVKINGRPNNLFVVDYEPLIYNVIGNLVGNASKFSSPFSTVSIEINCDSELQISVHDEGGGFSGLPENSESFEIDAVLKQTTGQGLKIARDTMNYLNGGVKVSNTRSGARVLVYLLSKV